jgi:ElaB/YqjD/DUF883 family membrane-anchored ribosome-binding protein
MTTERETEEVWVEGDTLATADASATGEPEVEVIVAEIEQTRAEMGGTIAELGDRLDPQRLATQARDTVREQTVGRVEEMVSDVRTTAQETGNGIVQTIRQNPIPAAMAGVGVWMLWQRYQSQQSSSQRSGYRYDDRTRYTGGYAYGAYPQADYRYAGYEGDGGNGGGIQERAGQVAGQAQETIGNVTSTAQDALGNATSTAQQTVGDITDKAGQTADQLARQARQAPDQITRMMEENPLAFGLAAVAVGAAVGLSIPTTRKEQEVLGQAREQVAHRAAETMEQASSTLQETASQESSSESTEMSGSQEPVAAGASGEQWGQQSENQSGGY